MIRLAFTVFLSAVFVFITGSCMGQAPADSIGRLAKDTAIVDRNGTTPEVLPSRPAPFQPNPKKAGLYSAIVPGLGQLYNREYWKIPVIYAGIGVAGYFIGHNLNLYLSYREAYIGRINNPNPTDKYVNIYDSSQLKQLQNDYSKYLDLTVLITVIGYGVQVLDAVTSAHLKNFDISRDISVKLRPIVLPNFAGVTFTFHYKSNSEKWQRNLYDSGPPGYSMRPVLTAE